MKKHITQKEWLKLDKDLRRDLILTFAINKSEGVSVVDSEIVSDGCSQQDLIDGLTIGKMIEFLGNKWKKVDNDELFDSLLQLSIDKITNKTNESNKENEQVDGTEQAEASTEGSREGGAVETGKVNERAPRKGKVSAK